MPNDMLFTSFYERAPVAPVNYTRTRWPWRLTCG